MAAEEKIEVTLASGWVHGRLATDDDRTGQRQTVAGLEMRVRLSAILAYQQSEPGVLGLWITELEEPMFLIGSLEAMDKIMARAELKEIS